MTDLPLAAPPATRHVPAVENDPVADGLAWVDDAPNSEIFEERAFVRWLLAALVHDEAWEAVVSVARKTHRAMALGGRWGTWKLVLETAEHAARAGGLDRDLGWAMHQLGSRDLLRDDLKAARPQLDDALAFRERIGDVKGVAVTRSNLQILPLALAGGITVLTVFVGLVALIVPTFDDPDVPAPRAILDITTEVVTYDEVTAAGFTIEVKNLGNVPLVDFTVSSENPDAPVIGAIGDCGTTISLDGSCELTLDVSQIDPEAHLPLVVNVEFPTATDSGPAIQEGDRRVLIRVGGE